MKCVTVFIFSCWLMLACHSASNRNENTIDTSSSTNVTKEKRHEQIDNAKYNRGFITGKWQIIDVRFEDDPRVNVSDESDAGTTEFFSTDSFKVFRNNKITERGTYEWMAADRELVMTSSRSDSVMHLLIKSIDDQYLKVKFNGLNVTFKKEK